NPPGDGVVSSCQFGIAQDVVDGGPSRVPQLGGCELAGERLLLIVDGGLLRLEVAQEVVLPCVEQRLVDLVVARGHAERAALGQEETVPVWVRDVKIG